MPATKKPIGQIVYYSRAMQAPRIRETATRLADQAREGGWTHEECHAAVLSWEVAAREASGREIRTGAAGFPAGNFDHQPGLNRALQKGWAYRQSFPSNKARTDTLQPCHG